MTPQQERAVALRDERLQQLSSEHWESRITDNLDTSSNVFECGVKDVVRDMRFRVEVD